MKNTAGLWLLLMITLNLSCNSFDRQIQIYFDPSGAFYLDEVPLQVKIDNEIILDTVVENTHVNNSLFMTSFKRAQKNGVLSAEVNHKPIFLCRLSEISLKCTDIFLGYDDHSLLLEKGRIIENQRLAYSIEANYKEIVDSIKAVSGTKYDQIRLSIKEGKCDQ